MTACMCAGLITRGRWSPIMGLAVSPLLLTMPLPDMAWEPANHLNLLPFEEDEPWSKLNSEPSVHAHPAAHVSMIC